ncbi:MAG TPA: flagellar hook-basal body complex protein [Ferrovibrio sp.]|uniref:flagellar hook protein FlgE n=1 Tax=Ferrovibrio sp. TaxID=1917215 RepID=UPI002B4B9008|nr:flagellar hook-basal body complex protein [Ferrovibrio sp.]HLT78722.1 flagellar hook-basal body complex protein [Ferrovibrio sp.]
MTFYGALGTAVQGITAQAAAIGHISDNVSNATTKGYKQVSTLFSDLVFNKVAGESPVMDSNRHMGVTSIADFNNRKQGTIVGNGNLSSIAVNGNGFIPVARATGINSATGEPTGFETATYYTRLGDFRLDITNRLVNSAGDYLLAAAPGQTNRVSDFVVDDSPIAAIPTTSVDYQVNLPGAAQVGRTYANGIGIIDAAGNERNFQLYWEKTGTDTWDLTINTAGGTPASFGPVTVTFLNGALDTMTTTDPALAVTGAGAATVTLSPNFGSGAQALTLNLGTFGGGFDPQATSGLTQYSSQTTDLSNVNLRQNGLPGGEFSYVSIQEDGQIIYNYTNGRSQVGGQLLLANFPEPDRLDRVSGTAFLASGVSGDPVFGVPGDPDGTTGLGPLVSAAVEESNVDVAEQMTRLIVAQQAYSMNGQIITTANEMLSSALDMKR